MAENEKVFMEQAEYMDYLKNQIHNSEEKAAPVAQLTMYQMNKDLVKGLKKMNNMAINKALEKLVSWFDPKVTHYALLNHEQHYFTIFEASEAVSSDSFIAAVKDILTNYYGDNDIRAIDVQEDGAVEIWAMWNGEPTVAYLFPYSQGVVYY